MIDFAGRSASPSTRRTMVRSAGAKTSAAVPAARTEDTSSIGAPPRGPPSRRRTASAARDRRSPAAARLMRLRLAIWLNVSISTEKTIAA